MAKFITNSDPGSRPGQGAGTGGGGTTPPPEPVGLLPFNLPPMQPGDYTLPALPRGLAQSGTLASEIGSLIPFFIPTDCTLTDITLYYTAADADNDLDVGVHSMEYLGVVGEQLAYTRFQTHPASYGGQLIVFSGGVELAAGWYWLALYNRSATGCPLTFIKQGTTAGYLTGGLDSMFGIWDFNYNLTTDSCGYAFYPSGYGLGYTVTTSDVGNGQRDVPAVGLGVTVA